jgi:hypothetical protein
MSLWVCAEHGLYGGQVFCPRCGKTGRYAALATELGVLPASGMPLREDPQGLRPKAGSPVPKGDAK